MGCNWDSTGYADYQEKQRLKFKDLVRESLDNLDGTPESAVSLITGVPKEKLDEYGGMPKNN